MNKEREDTCVMSIDVYFLALSVYLITMFWKPGSKSTRSSHRGQLVRQVGPPGQPGFQFIYFFWPGQPVRPPGQPGFLLKYFKKIKPGKTWRVKPVNPVLETRVVLTRFFGQNRSNRLTRPGRPGFQNLA
jgi:hypothetical protein